MAASRAKSKIAIGFLTVVETPEQGLFGGYLVVSAAGRPLEFHCTAPIRPSRAQEILYGVTLQSYLFGEQIGQTLLRAAKIKPVVVCTDREPALAVSEFVDIPVALVLDAEEADQTHDSPDTSSDAPSRRIDPPGRGGPHRVSFTVGRNRLAVAAQGVDAERRVAERLGDLGDSLDLCEPFQRIRDAILEARNGGRST